MQFELHDELKRSVAITLSKKIKDSFNQEVSLFLIYQNLATPPDRKLGDLALNPFIISKELKLSPNDFTKNLIFKDDGFVKETLQAGPYLNIKLDYSKLAESILKPIEDGSFFSKKMTQNPEKTMIEYSQPNTHKELHVGHMRNLCLGSALINIFRYAGIETIASTFPGDVGTHVAKCLWYLKNKNIEEIPTTNKGAWLGSMYSKAHNLLEDERGTEREEKNREALTLILKELEKKEGPYYDLWLETREWSISLMKEVYKWAHVDFDVWYWESEVDSESVKLIKEYYEKGVFVKDEGAIGINLEEEKLGFCLLIKSDGNGLYATKDIELARRKFQDFSIKRNLYVVDKRQELHFKQVFATLKRMGFKEADQSFHIKYDFVELPSGAMSSRKGNIVPLLDLVKNMEAMIKEKYLTRYEKEWSSEEINHVAHIVAEGAIKYGMTRMDNSKKIVFDMEEWLKLDGESGPYIQYVCARINSMLLKVPLENKNIQYNLLSHELETNLLLKLSEFNNAVENAVKNYKPSAITSYLYDLSKLFNSFYAELSIQNAETPSLRDARRALASSCQLVLKNGLKLLGIEAPERM